MTEEFIEYLRVEKKYSPLTCVSYKLDLQQFAAFLAQECELQDLFSVKHQVVRSWIVHLMTDQLHASTVNRKISALRSFYRWALKKKKTANNPMLKIAAPKKPKRLPVFIPGTNLSRLFELTSGDVRDEPDFKRVRDHFIIEVLYGTGMRRAELINLRLSDFNVHRKEVRVTGKGHKVRSIPLTDRILHDYQAYLKIRETKIVDNTDHVFITEKGKHVYEKLIYNIVKNTLGNITTQGKKSPHVLRHTFATHLLNEGAELNAIKELLGHASLAATQVYTHNSISKLREVYKKAHPEGSA